MSPRAIAVALALAASVFARSAAALTADEVLRLKAAGVSDHTIQMMMKDEQADAANAASGPPPAQAAPPQAAQPQVPQSMVEQTYAEKHIGSWDLPDGSRVISTGQDHNGFFDPTIPVQNPYPMNIYPYVFPGGGGPMPGPFPGGGGAAGGGGRPMIVR